MRNSIIIVAIVFVFLSCKKKDIYKEVTENSSKIKDLVLVILPKNTIKLQQTLTEEIAIKTLNNYFKNKGYLIQSEIEGHSEVLELSENKNKKSISFSAVFPFKDNKAAVITYYNCFPFQSGHCVQPHNAIISNSEKGFTISNEDFLPPNFNIDSINTVNKKTVIYAVDYNCALHKVMNNYKIEVK
jgi:hypothetical protein